MLFLIIYVFANIASVHNGGPEVLVWECSFKEVQHIVKGLSSTQSFDDMLDIFPSSKNWKEPECSPWWWEGRAEGRKSRLLL